MEEGTEEWGRDGGEGEQKEGLGHEKGPHQSSVGSLNVRD